MSDVLGVPNGFNALGLQVVLYEHALANQMGIVFGSVATSAGLHMLADVLAAISTLITIAGFIMSCRHRSECTSCLRHLEAQFLPRFRATHASCEGRIRIYQELMSSAIACRRAEKAMYYSDSSPYHCPRQLLRCLLEHR